MSQQLYKATKEGYDGKQIRKVGEVFPFAGKRGSWMVPCDSKGNPTEAIAKERETRLGTKVTSNHSGLTREELREECRKLGISFKATDSGVVLAELLQKHGEAKSQPAALPAGPSAENPDGGAPGVGGAAAPGGGTGDLEVL